MKERGRVEVAEVCPSAGDEPLAAQPAQGINISLNAAPSSHPDRDKGGDLWGCSRASGW